MTPYMDSQSGTNRLSRDTTCPAHFVPLIINDFNHLTRDKGAGQRDTHPLRGVGLSRLGPQSDFVLGGGTNKLSRVEASRSLAQRTRNELDSDHRGRRMKRVTRRVTPSHIRFAPLAQPDGGRDRLDEEFRLATAGEAKQPNGMVSVHPDWSGTWHAVVPHQIEFLISFRDLVWERIFSGGSRLPGGLWDAIDDEDPDLEPDDQDDDTEAPEGQHGPLSPSGLDEQIAEILT